MTIKSIETIRDSLKLLLRLNEFIAQFSKSPDRISCALKDIKRGEIALAEFNKLVYFDLELDNEV